MEKLNKNELKTVNAAGIMGMNLSELLKRVDVKPDHKAHGIKLRPSFETNRDLMKQVSKIRVQNLFDDQDW